MKEVKEYYNSKAQIHAENNKNISEKVAKVTEQKWHVIIFLIFESQYKIKRIMKIYWNF